MKISLVLNLKYLTFISTLNIKNKKKPLEKVKILDIGCGGGLLSEPMSRLGAEVTGIDASDKNISIAGKTGTSQIDYTSDETQYVSSFVGYFPADNPKYSAIVGETTTKSAPCAKP